MAIVTRYHCIILLLLFFTATETWAQQHLNNAPLSSNAPTDQPLSVVSTEEGKELQAFEAVIAPAVKQARKTLPQVKKRYQRGLPANEAFFLTTRIFDTDGKFEQVFVRVTSWEDSKVTGTIANDLGTVKQYQANQSITFPEKAILDWTIAKPDGSEEGNYVGKLIDTLQQ